MDFTFEELEKVEEFDAVGDFAKAAAPWIAIGVSIAIFAAT